MNTALCVAVILSLLGAHAASAQSRALAEQAVRCAGLRDAGEASRIKVGMAPKPELAAEKTARWFEMAKKADPTMTQGEMQLLSEMAAKSYSSITDAVFQGLTTRGKAPDPSFDLGMKFWGKLSDRCDNVAIQIDGLAP